MSSESPKWSGPLKSKKKAELQEICRALGIEFRPDTIKLELEQDIVSVFKANPGLQTDRRFEELSYPHQPSTPPESGSGSAAPTRLASRRGTTAVAVKSVRPRSSSSRRGERLVSDEDEEEEDEEPQEERVRKSNPPSHTPPSRRSSRRKSILSHITDQVDRLPSSAELVKAVGTAERGVENAISQASLKIDATKPVKFLKELSSKVVHNLGCATAGLADLTLSGVQATQYALSSPWAIWALLIFAELAYVFYSLVSVDYKPLRQPEYFIRLPISVHAAIQLLISERFLRPLLDYTILTIILPLSISSLINFTPSPTTNTTKNNTLINRLKILKPSPLTFSSIRLSILVLLNSLFNHLNKFGWSSLNFIKDQENSFLNNNNISSGSLIGNGGWSCKNPELIGLEVIQVVTCCLGITFGLHQLISQVVHHTSS